MSLLHGKEEASVFVAGIACEERGACVHTHVSVSVAVPPNIAELKNLEVLNFFNNQIEELPTQISSLQKLKHLNLG